MQIGIFGDSYSTVNQRFVNKRPDGKCWAQLLSDQYSVKNYSVSGTGLYYSYREFLKHQHNFDCIIFTASLNQRLYLENLPIKDPTSKHINLELLTDRNQAHEWLNYVKTTDDSVNWDDVFDSVQGYFRYVYNDDQNTTAERLLLQDIQTKNRVLLMPCFESTLNAHREIFKNFKISLSNITFLEDARCNLTQQKIRKIRKQLGDKVEDTRHCHLTDENNIMMYNKIVNWIENNEFSLQQLDILNPQDLDLERYLK